jgi:hypothetical protein
MIVVTSCLSPMYPQPSSSPVDLPHSPSQIEIGNQRQMKEKDRIAGNRRSMLEM